MPPQTKLPNPRWLRRLTTGGSTSKTGKARVVAAVIWMRLERMANVVTAYQSANGTNNGSRSAGTSGGSDGKSKGMSAFFVSRQPWDRCFPSATCAGVIRIIRKAITFLAAGPP